MNRTKLPIRKRLENVLQSSGSVDAAVAEASALMVKSIHFTQNKAQTQMDALKDAFHEVKFKYGLDLQKQLKPLLFKQDKLEANQTILEATQAKIYGQLDEVQESM
ncbi:hypothetical protein AgCh_013682 [Apium graveolens]